MKEHRSQQRSDSPRAGGGVSGSARRQVAAARRPFAVFDIDGTLIRWQLYHAVADALAKGGHASPEIYQAMRDARMTWKRRADADAFKAYEEKVIFAYEKALQKMNFSQFGKIAEQVFDEYKEQVYTYTRGLISELKGKGYVLLAISGSPVEIVEHVVKFWGFDDFLGTVYARKGNGFSGKKIVHAFDKARALKSMVDRHGLDLKASVGVGDTKSDIPMLKMVEKPIAFNPDRDLFEHAKKQGWKVVIERKNMVYELEKQNGRYQLVKTSA
ncbi:HAD family phosphatase [Candidatus Saccharibacteria bacterium]|nr:HAD family phosphatase [Candidatus Saccharibacteria bacterium]